MTIFDRRQRLLELLRNSPGLGVSHLAEKLDVSQGTIRNDFEALMAEQLIVRVRGGAILKEPNQSKPLSVKTNAFASRIEINKNVKKCIANTAAALVNDGDAILLDASTTVYHMTSYLLDRHNLRIVTNCIETAHQLAQNPTHTIMLVGGILRAGTTSVIGPWSENYLSEICTRYAFVSCSGFNPETGMTEVDLFEAQFRLKAIQSTEKVIGLIDSSKFGKTDLTPSLQPKQIHSLFTDDGLEPTWVKQLEVTGYNFQLCPLGDTSLIESRNTNLKKVYLKTGDIG